MFIKKDGLEYDFMRVHKRLNWNIWNVMQRLTNYDNPNQKVIKLEHNVSTSYFILQNKYQ